MSSFGAERVEDLVMIKNLRHILLGGVLNRLSDVDF